MINLEATLLRQQKIQVAIHNEFYNFNIIHHMIEAQLQDQTIRPI